MAVGEDMNLGVDSLTGACERHEYSTGQGLRGEGVWEGERACEGVGDSTGACEGHEYGAGTRED